MLIADSPRVIAELAPALRPDARQPYRKMTYVAVARIDMICRSGFSTRTWCIGARVATEVHRGN